MPARKKPKTERQRSNHPPELRAVPDIVRPDPPPCPKRVDGKPMLAEVRAAWAALWDDDVASAIRLGLHGSSLVRLFRLYDERIVLERVYRKRRLVTGSTGQLVEHPFGRRIATIDSEVRAIEDRFGLNLRSTHALLLDMADGVKSIEDLNASLAAEAEDDPRVVDVEVAAEADEA